MLHYRIHNSFISTAAIKTQRFTNIWKAALAPFAPPLTTPLPQNEYRVKHVFNFVEKIWKQGLSLSMGSLLIDSNFTNITLHETIDICVNQLFENTDTIEGFRKSKL